MLDVRLLLLLLLLVILVLIALPQVRSSISDASSRLRRRRDPRTPYTGVTIISGTGDEIEMPDDSVPDTPGWADRLQAMTRNQRLLTVLVLLLFALLALPRVPRVLGPAQTDQFVVLVAPFREPDGSVGQTGRSVADQLVQILPEKSGGRVRAQRVVDPPADASAAVALVEREGADALIWGTVTRGDLLDQQSLLPLLAYRPSGAFAPAGWDGYTGRFATPSVYALASMPVNGQAVLPSLLGAVADYGAGQVDRSFETLGQLADNYPLTPVLPRMLRGNIFWARGEYQQAAGEYRRALAPVAGDQLLDSQPGQAALPDPQALLANNLGAILQDAGDPAARDSFAQSVKLLHGQDLGELRFNLGISALRDGQIDDAVAALEQARNLLPPSTPLLLTLSEAYRQHRQFDQAREVHDAAVQQVRIDADKTTTELRDLSGSRLRGATQAQGALLQLAQLLQASGPLAWAVQASGPLAPDSLDDIREDLAQAVRETDTLEQGWNRLSVAKDAASQQVASLIALGQARRADAALRDRQRWLAAVEIEIARARGVRPPQGIAALWSRLVGDRSPLGQARSQLNALLAIDPKDVDSLVLLGRAQLSSDDLSAAASQFDAAAAAAPHRPEPVYGQAFVALKSDGGEALDASPPKRARARALLSQAIALNERYYPARQKLAELAQADKDWPVAIEQRRWLARERPSPANTIALAQTLRLSGPAGYAEAERLLLPLASADNVKALIELGRLYQAHGDLAGARMVLERAQRLAPNDPEVAYEYGQLLAAQGDTAGAIAQYQHAIDIDPQNIPAHLELAKLYGSSGEAAAQQYRAALAAGANDPATLRQIGGVLLANGEYDAAIDAYARAVKARPEDPELHHLLAQAYLKRGQLDSAEREEQKALDLRGGNYPEALVGLGDVALQRNDAEGAIRQYNAALQQNDKLTAAYLGIGRANAAEGRWSVAASQFQNAVARDEGSPEAHLWLGEALIRQRDTLAATAEYSRAIALKPDYAEAYFGLAQAQLDMGQLDQAEANLSTALRLRPAYAEAYLLQGKLYEKRGNIDQAIAAYGKSIGVNGKLFDPHYARALLYIRQDRMAEAESDLEAATRIRPDSAEAHYWLGRTYFAEGRAAAARDQFKEASDRRGGNYPEARFYQGLAEEQLGQRDAAVASFRAALEQDRNGAWAGEAQAALARLGQP